MTILNKILLAAVIAAPITIAAPAAQAQIGGVAVADPDGAIANTKAWQTARTQIQTTYKAQIDQAEARRQALTTELQPLVTAYQTAQSAPNANKAALQTQAQNIQNRENAANTELQRLTAPASRAQAYALEQLRAKLPDAVNAAVKAKNVSLLLSPQAALMAQPNADITSAITAQLDQMVPTVNTTPPANWQPGQDSDGGAPTSAAPATAPSMSAVPAKPAAGRKATTGR